METTAPKIIFYHLTPNRNSCSYINVYMYEACWWDYGFKWSPRSAQSTRIRSQFLTVLIKVDGYSKTDESCPPWIWAFWTFVNCLLRKKSLEIKLRSSSTAWPSGRPQLVERTACYLDFDHSVQSFLWCKYCSCIYKTATSSFFPV